MSLLKHVHPEANIDGFTRADGTVRFFAFVWACILQTKATRILDYGAGRGAFFFTNTAETGSLFRKHLQDLRNTGAQVTACDIDGAVLDHPCSNERVQITPGEALPFANESFDVIVSDHTFEHIEDAAFAASELVRVLRQGGYICVRTPSRYGYVALISALIPNRLHTAVIRRAQSHRKTEDVFPTVYRLNTPAQLHHHFPCCTIYHYYFSGEPSYAFGNRLVYGGLWLLHRLLPGPLNTSLCAFIRKPGAVSSDPSDGRGSRCRTLEA